MLRYSILFGYQGEANDIQQMQNLCKQNILKNNIKISTTFEIEIGKVYK